MRALKGLVRLQAIVRGRAVRRQAIATMKCLPSNGAKQLKVQENRDPICKYGEHEKFIRSKEELEEKEIKVSVVDMLLFFWLRHFLLSKCEYMINASLCCLK